MHGRRHYRDPCPVAQALDLVGERWALLVVRELLPGPKRFTDLRAQLHGVSPNVLSQRLEELEAATVIERRYLPPPAASHVYALSPRGRELEPIVRGLARFGRHCPPPADASALSPSSVILQLEAAFDPEAAAGLKLRVLLCLGPEQFRYRITKKELRPETAEANEAALGLTCEPGVLLTLLRAEQTLDAALAAGALQIDGEPELARRFLAAFRTP